jgi:Tol biopolymer transport system component
VDRAFTPIAWSPDGSQLVGDGGQTGRFEVFAYAFASKRFTRLSDVGWPWTWLGDGRRLLYSNRGKLFVLDSVSKRSREILSVAPDDFDGVALSPDNRTIYFTRTTQQGNIWLMTSK